MAIEDNNRYYGLDGDKDLDGSEANYETAENIDAVLRDMTDIYQNAPAADIGKAVVLDEVETEGAQAMRRFKLKEVSKPINAYLKEIIVGDGNNWAKGNGYAYKIDYIWLDPSTVTTGGPSNFAVAHYVQSMPSTFGVMTEVMAPNNQPFNPPRYVLKSGFTTRDTAKQKIAGTAQINIGDDNKSYSSEAFWGSYKSGPEIDIQSAAKIEMTNGGITGTIPVISMRGNGLIDMEMENPNYYNHPWTVHQDFTDLRRYINPYSINKNAPIFQLKGKPVVSIVEQATIQVKNNATVQLAGNADIHIVGNEYTSESMQNVKKHSVAWPVKAYTSVYMGPNSSVRFAGDNLSTVGFCVDSNQIFLGTVGGRTVNYGRNSLSEVSSDHSYAMYDGAHSSSARSGLINGYPGTDIFQIRKPVRVSSYQNLYNSLRTLNPGPEFLFCGPTTVRIDGQGRFGANISKASDSAMVLDLTTEEGSYIATHFGAGSYSNVDFDLDFTANSKFFLRCAPDGNSETFFNIQPSGTTAVNFDPIGAFGLSFVSNYTELDYKWKKLQGIYGGIDHFIQFDGSNHIEAWSGTVILRQQSTIGKTAVSGDNEAGYPLFPNATQEISKSGWIFVNADLSNMTNQEIIDTYETELKSATTLATNARANEFTWDRISSVSKSKIPAAYKETIVVSNITVKNASCDSDFYSDNVYTVQTLAESDEFKRWYSERLGYDESTSITITPYPEAQITKSSGGTYSGVTYAYKYDLWKFYCDITGLSTTATNIVYTPTTNNASEIPQYKYQYIGTGSYGGSYYAGSRVGMAGIRTTNYSNNDGGQGDYSNARSNWSSTSLYSYKESISVNGVKLKNTYGQGVYIYSDTYVDPTNQTTFFQNPAIIAAMQDARTSSSLRSGKILFGSIKPDAFEADTGCFINYSYASSNPGGRPYRYQVGKFIAKYNQPISASTIAYGTSSSTIEEVLNCPNTTYANLTSAQQTYIRNAIKNSTLNSNASSTSAYSYTSVVTDEIVTANDHTLAELPKYKVTANSVYVGPDSHLEKDWHGPIQTADRVGSSWQENGPIIQAYGPTNFMMREKYSPELKTWTMTTTADEFDLTDMNVAIRQFLNSTHYDDLITYIGTQSYSNTDEFWYVDHLTKTDSTHYVVYFAVKKITWKPRLDSYTDTPIVEICDDSELRMYGGARIKAETVYGETTFTFSASSDTSSEQSVSFTLAELAALKNMLINPPQSFIPLTQAEYDQLDPPDPDTLYVITDGATAQMLPDASVEEF